MTDPLYNSVYEETRGLEVQRRRLMDAQEMLSGGATLPPELVGAVNAARGAASSGGDWMAAISGADGKPVGDAALVTAYVGYLNKQIEGNVSRLYSIDPNLANLQYPDQRGNNLDMLKKMGAMGLGGIGGGGGVAALPSYSFMIGKHGEVIRTSSAGAWEIIGTHPELADKQTTTQVDKTTGRGWAITLDADGKEVGRTDLGIVDFPEIDPERKFRLDLLTQAANVEQSMAGIEVQQRGQLIKAIGDDYARQVELGNMQYTESRLNLDRISTAVSARRDERAQMLQYAVTQASLRTDPTTGQQVTVLPFAKQLGNILSATTGQQFGESDFTLGVGYINPDQTANDILNGSKFESPISNLAAQLSSARAATTAILGKPLGNQAASEQVVKMATGAAA